MKDFGSKLAMVLAASLVSLLVLTATMGATFQTEEGVSRQIEVESPYVKDRNLILHRLGEIEKKLDSIIKYQQAE